MGIEVARRLQSISISTSGLTTRGKRMCYEFGFIDRSAKKWMENCWYREQIPESTYVWVRVK